MFLDAGRLAILMVFSIPLAAILGGIGLAALKILKGNGGGRSAEENADETRLIQDINHGLQKMEQRVEALETILLGKERKEGDT